MPLPRARRSGSLEPSPCIEVSHTSPSSTFRAHLSAWAEPLRTDSISARSSSCNTRQSDKAHDQVFEPTHISALDRRDTLVGAGQIGRDHVEFRKSRGDVLLYEP
jgi:hypothetical protein